ncbi:hypothetical protein SASPL_122104 [Salvia splendens]|uniref:Uncharacterized protein n=1 Tax=Salvia splendens TaxID=180675 RepID=A0A8X8XIZ8_SALSN|nr:hypothetical protein SASPL_122104 [Salvia splendens]
MESRVFNSRYQIFEDDDAQSQRSKYTSLRDLKLVRSNVLVRNRNFKDEEVGESARSNYTSLRGHEVVSSNMVRGTRKYDPSTGDPLLRRVAMLYGRTGAPRPERRSSSTCPCSRMPRWMKKFMRVCFGFNIDYRDID